MDYEVAQATHLSPWKPWICGSNLFWKVKGSLPDNAEMTNDRIDGTVIPGERIEVHSFQV